MAQQLYLMFQGEDGTHVGRAYGPPPEIGWVINITDFESETEWVVTGVKLYVENRNVDDVPFINRVLVSVAEKNARVRERVYAREEQRPTIPVLA